MLNGDDLEHIFKCTVESRPECPILVIVKFAIFYYFKKFKQHNNALFHVLCKGGNFILDKKKGFIASCKPSSGEDGKACIKLSGFSHW